MTTTQPTTNHANRRRSLSWLVAALALGLGCGESTTTQTVSDVTPPPPDGLPIYTEPTEPAPAPGEELPIEVVRTFTCVPEGVGAELVVAEVVGAPGERVLIRPVAAEACRYDLIHRASDGAERVLSELPGGYLFAAALRTDDGVTVVCANNIAHRAEGAGGLRYVDGVGIACAAAGADGVFGRLRAVVAPGPDWAAWLRNLAAVDDAPRRFALRYVRDSSFHFFNLSDNGRPPTDGVFEVAFEVNSAAGIHPLGGPPLLVDQRTNPLVGLAIEEWTPTEADEAAYGEFIDFSDGPCPEGCPDE